MLFGLAFVFVGSLNYFIFFLLYSVNSTVYSGQMVAIAGGVKRSLLFMAAITFVVQGQASIHNGNIESDRLAKANEG